MLADGWLVHQVEAYRSWASQGMYPLFSQIESLVECSLGVGWKTDKIQDMDYDVFGAPVVVLGKVCGHWMWYDGLIAFDFVNVVEMFH